MLEFPNIFFRSLHKYFANVIKKTRNDEKIYLELKNVKQEEIKRVEVYYEHI
jgi:hypothetical protein